MTAKNLTNRDSVKINDRFRKIKMVAKMPLIEQVSVIFSNGDTIRWDYNEVVEVR